MSTTGDLLYTLVSTDVALLATGITATNIRPGFAPPGTSGKYITYFQVSGPRLHSLTGPQGNANQRWQFNIWCDDPSNVGTIADALRQCLDGYNSGAILGTWILDERETPDSSPDTDSNRQFGKQQDYLVHSTETP